MSLDVAWVEDQRDFATLAGEWDALLPDDASPFDQHCWYLTWWESFGASDQLAVCTLRRDGELAGAFPLRRSGGDLKALANVHSPLFRPLARDAEALTALIAAALDDKPIGFELFGVPERDPCVAQLRNGIRSASMTPLIEPVHVSPIVDTSGNFDAWRNQSKPRWGAPLERFRRKMGRDHEAELLMVEAPTDLEADLTDGFRVEGSGWKGQSGTAIVSAPETETFYRGVARAFQRRNELRLSRIVLDGTTVAFDLCLLYRARLYLLKTGYDEEFRRLAPGLVLRLSTIERCFELGLTSHELLGDESEWKSKFATSERPHVTFRAYRHRPASLVQYTYRAALRPMLRHAYRRLSGRSASMARSA